MKPFSNFGFLIILLILLWGCEKEKEPVPKELIEISLQNTDEYIHDFEICGDEEGATIETSPQHAEISEIVRDASTDWCVVYKYKPESGFVGKDYVEIKTCTGGGISCTEIEIVRIEFTVTD